MPEETGKGKRRQRAARGDVEGFTNERDARASEDAVAHLDGAPPTAASEVTTRITADDLEVTLRERREEEYGEVQ